MTAAYWACLAVTVVGLVVFVAAARHQPRRHRSTRARRANSRIQLRRKT